MELHETEERQDLRKAVAEIAKDFGHEYYLEKSLAGGKSTELWQAVGKHGFLGVNLSEQYGGGGVFNAHATFAAKNTQAEYLFVHEFSHHFAALADEYYTSDVAYETGLTNRPEPWEPNITALKSPGGLKWKDLVVEGTPIPTPWKKEAFDEHSKEYQQQRRALREQRAPEADLDALAQRSIDWQTKFFAGLPHAGRVGAYEGAGYETKGLYRPEADCIMFSRNPVGFCRVCRRGIERVIDLVTGH